MSMDYKDIQELIGKECGWSTELPKSGRLLLPYRFYHKDSNTFALDLPDYPNDLNACHEMENELEDGDPPDATEADKYAAHLDNMAYRPWHATALQRCEAFLRVKGLWEEAK